MRSSNGRYVISFNGEIYNYRALREALLARGRHLRSESDTEVLLHLYAEKGAEMVHDLRGMFAFAIWDSVERAMFLARDHFGIKPLYYADDGRTIRFASEVKALLAGSRADIDTSPEPAGHVGFFLWGSVPEPYTLYRGIRALPAGTTMFVSAQGAKLAPAFADVTQLLADAEGDTRTPTRSTAMMREELREVLLDSVRHHMVADVDVGVFLSAGLDSTTIAALAKEAGGKLQTVTLGFEEYRGTAQDEVPLAEAVAKHYNSEHRTVWVTHSDFTAELPRLLDRMDQPSTDGVNTYFVARAASMAGLKVALSGLGGDELFGGYPSFDQIPRLVSLVGAIPAARRIGRGIRSFVSPLLGSNVSQKYAGLCEYGGDFGGAYLLRRSTFMPWELSSVLDADLVRRGMAELMPRARLERTASRLVAPRLKVSALEASYYMRNQLLRDADAASMSASLEVRVPFVDWCLWKRVAKMTAAGEPITKRLMAETAEPGLPHAIVERAKTGFDIPTGVWLGNVSDRYRGYRGLRGWAQFVYERETGVEIGDGTRRRARGMLSPVARGSPGGIIRRASGRIRHRAWERILRVLDVTIGPYTERPLDLTNTHRILVLQLQQLGDSIAFTPALRAIREAHPNARLDMLANAISLGLYQKSPHVDRFFVDRWTNGRDWKFTRLLGLLYQIRRERYDIVIADCTQRSARYGLVAFLTGARKRVGFAIDGRGFFFTTRLPYEPHASVIDANLVLARALGASEPRPDVECYFDDDDACYARALDDGSSVGPLVAIHAGSNWQSKTWYPDRWAQVADALMERYGARIMYVGSGREAETVERVLGLSKHPGKSMVGLTTLPQLAALLARCDLVIGTDSGPRHLAAGSGRPQVTLMSAHEYAHRWHFHREHEILLRTEPPCSPCFQSYCSHRTCMDGLSVAAVLEACETLLSVGEVQMQSDELPATTRATV